MPKIRTLCPFCFASVYLYRTRNGLARHVRNNHSLDKRKKWNSGRVELLRTESQNGIAFEPVKGWKEVDEFLSDYLKGFKNPSKRSSRLWGHVYRPNNEGLGKNRS